jgi:hypothetical protein
MFVFLIRNFINLDDQYQVFYVDWGNEEKINKDRIRICPEAIRYIPWLANRVKFHNEQLTTEEFDGKYTFLSNQTNLDLCRNRILEDY